MKVLYVITFLVYYSCYSLGYYVVLTSSNCLIVRLFSDAVCHRIYNKRRYNNQWFSNKTNIQLPNLNVYIKISAFPVALPEESPPLVNTAIAWSSCTKLSLRMLSALRNSLGPENG